MLKVETVATPFIGGAIEITEVIWSSKASTEIVVRKVQTNEQARVVFNSDYGLRILEELRVSTENEAKPFKLIEGFESAFTLHSFMVRAQSSDVKTKPFGCSQARSRDSAAPSAFWSPCRVNARSFVTGASPSINSKVFSIFTLN